MPRLLNAFRDHLVSEGVVRDPDTVSGLPPMFLEPRDGLRAPGEGQGAQVGPDAVTGAYLSGGIAPGPFGAWRRLPFVEVRLRTRRAYLAEDLELAMSRVLIDRRDWVMGGLQITECLQVSPLQRLGSDAQGFEHTVLYGFELPRD